MAEKHHYSADEFARDHPGVRAEWFFITGADALADMGADATIGPAGAEMNTTYFDTDRVHMTNAGYAVVAGLVSVAIQGIG